MRRGADGDGRDRERRISGWNNQRMTGFKRLTVEEARTLGRAELLPLIEDEQKH
ncbi:hypothetical protein GCM10018952_51420 [Streptosporangium vulgare]